MNKIRIGTYIGTGNGNVRPEIVWRDQTQHQQYHQSEEWERAMKFLDDKGVPRFEKETDAEYSLVGRITLYKHTK
jgi:hypothetical protein